MNICDLNVMIIHERLRLEEQHITHHTHYMCKQMKQYREQPATTTATYRSLIV